MRKNQLLKEFQSSDQSIKSIANISTNFLINNQIKNGRNETEWYLQKLYQCDSIGLYNLKNQSINHDILNQLVDFLVKRCNKIPFQHLIGYAPFYGRDYIVRYTQLHEGNDIVYRFISVEDSGIPVHEDYVRLIHAAGEWRLHSLSDDKTEVTYIWNGELLGTFPDWALTKAWETQGNEVLNWLNEAVQN